MSYVRPFVLAALMATLAAPASAQEVLPAPGGNGAPESPVPQLTPPPVPVPRPAGTPTPAPTSQYEPAIVRVGTRAVLTIREPLGNLTPAQRAAVIQSRLDFVLLHLPHFQAGDVSVGREAGTPVIYWGQFPIASVDFVHAKLNGYATPDQLADVWAENLRKALRAFTAAKQLPERVLYRDERGSDYVYRRTEQTVADPSRLIDTRYVFTPNDLDWGAGRFENGHDGFVVFIEEGASLPPGVVYVGNPEGTFTAYEYIPPDPH